jgi:hypothetical protein
VNPNVVLPLGSSLLSFVFFVFLIDQWRERHRPYQLVWAIGMLWYALSAGTEFLGGALGWSEPLYRAWYLIGAIWVAGWLGLGTVMLLARTRFGLGMVPVFLLLALIALGGSRAYPNVGIAPPVYAAVALVLAIATAVLALRRDERWAMLVAGALVAGTVGSAALIAIVPLPSPGWVVDEATHIPTGALFPGYVRLLTPLFNVAGAWALVVGAIYSTYVFMPKRRVIRYSLDRRLPASRLARNLLVAPLAVAVNFAASVPGAIAAILRGDIHSRVPATMLIALGGLVPAITSGANRFGATSGFFVGEFLGVLLLFSGFLVSIEVFREVRIPFTHIVLQRRRAEA